jgi:tetratricopeptide (TPR) repeat protein
MACGRTIRKALVHGLVIFAVAFSALSSSKADPLKADITVDVSGGYARLVFALSDEVDADVHMAGNVLIVSFAQPVLVSVDRLAAQAPDYVATARRDPDGKAVRLALARPITVNSMVAGEKFFVDLLPTTWSGPPPGLPQEVVAELARRAREAERLARLEHRNAQEKKLDPVRVHVATQPTFVRYVFDIPEQTEVSADRAGERLTLTFGAPITFDLADAAAALPAAVAAINAEVEQDEALVRFSFLAKVDVRTFRDGDGYVVDIVGADAKADPQPEGGKKITANPPLAAGPLEKAAADVAAALAVEASAPITSQAPPAAAASPPQAKPAGQTISAQTAPAMSPTATDAKTAIAQAGRTTPSAPVAAPASAPTSAAPASAAAASEGAAAAPAHARSSDALAVEMSRQGANLKLSFPFLAPTAAAVFQRADTLWIVFDATATIDLSALEGEASRTIRGAEFIRTPDADIVRIRLDHPLLSSLATEGPAWTVTIGDTVFDPTHALDIARNLIGPNRASVTIPFEAPHQLHRIRDPEVGDDLLIVTGFTPARGFVNEQDFVEFRALASTQGVVVEPLADDVNVELAADKVVISRPGGLTLSSSLQSVVRGSSLRPVTFDSQLWGFDRQSTYSQRQWHLIDAAAAAPASKRLQPRLDLARFYIAREMYPEAKGVLDVALAEDRPAAEEVSAEVLRAIAEVMMNRPDDALKDLANPAIGDQHDAPLWRALAYAGEGKWAQARDSFKSVEAAIATLPIELQRVALKDEMRAAIEVGDFAGAADQLNDLETIGLPRELQPAISVLIGRLSEGMGRSEDALSAYRTAADSWDRPAAAQGRLRDVALRYSLGDLKREDVISELETLTTIWRGDETEVEALQILARLYTQAGRYRDSFKAMRSAMAAHPDSEMTRRIQEEAAATFETLFLAGKADSLPAIDALALFYDFRDLTPIGRRGDEMIRRLADRLVSVDLLDQAAELLQYQVDHRLQGAARAQVATRLAVIYLMNRKADRALATLRATRVSDLANELRNQRLLLEARALSDLGRHDLALEVVANIEGPEVIRLRSDILWAARRWGRSAEQIELYYGERWKEWRPLNDVERADILRAAIGYALAEDALGLSRFREKYAAKMKQTPDARAFEIVSAALGTSGMEFRSIARAAASVDTLEGFLRDVQGRYPDASAIPPTSTPPMSPAPGALAPSISSTAPEQLVAPAMPVPAPATAPAHVSDAPPGAAAGPESQPSGTRAAPPAPPARAAGRTAQR